MLKTMSDVTLHLASVLHSFSVERGASERAEIEGVATLHALTLYALAPGN